MPLTTQVVILQIGSEDETFESLNERVFCGVDISVIREKCLHYLPQLEPHVIGGKIFVWASKKKAGKFITKNISDGSIVLFIHKGVCAVTARIKDRFTDRELAAHLWRNHGSSPEEFRHFIVLEQPRYADNIPLSDILSLTRHPRDSVVRSILPIKDEISVKQIEDFLADRLPPPPPPTTGRHADPDKELGDAGERWVVDRLKQHVRTMGRPDLESKVEWVATENRGYDIQWINPDTNKTEHIEVKTTRGPLNTPFYITIHEKDVMEANESTYLIYRVYDFELVGERKHEPSYHKWTAADFRRFELGPLQFRVFPSARL